MPSVPIVDLSAFTAGGDEQARKQAAQELAEKIAVNGSVGISGHGISSAELEEAFNLMRRFFSLPEEDKLKAPYAVQHRGYTPVGGEKASHKTEIDVNGNADKVEEDALKAADFKVVTCDAVFLPLNH